MDKTITMTKDVRTKDGALWPKGTRIRTDDEELKQRGVPQDSYEVVGAKQTTPDKKVSSK